MVPRSINLVDNSEANCLFCVKAFTCMYFNELVCWGGGGGGGVVRTQILNKTQWICHIGNCYFLLNLVHVSVAYSAANIHAVAHATF